MTVKRWRYKIEMTSGKGVELHRAVSIKHVGTILRTVQENRVAHWFEVTRRGERLPFVRWLRDQLIYLDPNAEEKVELERFHIPSLDMAVATIEARGGA